MSSAGNDDHDAPKHTVTDHLAKAEASHAVDAKSPSSQQKSLASAFAWQYPTLWRQEAVASDGADEATFRHQRPKEEGRDATASTPKTGSRRRGAIPFELASVRTPPSSPSLANQSSPAVEAVSPTQTRTSNAYGTLSRVKDRDRVASTMRHSSTTSLQAAVNTTSPRVGRSDVDSRDSDASSAGSSWLAWGTMKFRDTVARGVSPSIFGPASPREHDEDGQSSIASTSTQSWFSALQGSRSPSAPSEASDEDLERYAEQIVHHCGKDAEGRAIISLAAPCLPPADVVSHDALLERILSRTRPIVMDAAGYTLVLYASGAEHVKGDAGFKTPWPGWTWCWRVWRSLDRSYRKNLKKLVIVHPTLFTRSLVRFVSSGSYFISPKFSRKIIECKDLQALAEHVPLAQLTIPSRVLIADLRSQEQEKEADVSTSDIDPSACTAAVFDDAIDAVCGRRNGKALVRTEGIFRVSPSISQLAAVKYAYTLQPHVDLAPYVERDRHLPAALLKAYLRAMDPPMVQAKLYPLIRQCPRTSIDQALSFVKDDFLPVLSSPERRHTFVRLMRCLAAVHAHRDVNRMDASNLAIVVAPSLVRSSDLASDIAMCAVPSSAADGNIATTLQNVKKLTLGILLQLCIEYCDDLFGEDQEGEDQTLASRRKANTEVTERKDVRGIFGP